MRVGLRAYDATPRGSLAHRFTHLIGWNGTRVVYVLRNGHHHVTGECVTCGAHSQHTNHSRSCPCTYNRDIIAAGWAALEGR